jgi:hypothetical protein
MQMKANEKKTERKRERKKVKVQGGYFTNIYGDSLYLIFLNLLSTHMYSTHVLNYGYLKLVTDSYGI